MNRQFRHRSVLTPLLALTLLMALVSTAHGALFFEEPLPLFATPDNIPENMLPPGEPTVIRSRPVDVNFDGLGAAGDPADALLLNLFEDATFTALFERTESNVLGSYAWIGHLEGIDHSHSILVVTDGLLSGSISMPGANFQVRPVSGHNVHVVLEIDQSLFPPELEPAVVVSRPQALRITEGGDGTVYGVALATKPARPVTVDIVADAQIGTDPTALTFDVENWDVAQTVFVQAIDDALDESEHRSVIGHIVVSSDGDYNGMSADAIELVVADNDRSGVDVSPKLLGLLDGVAASYSLTLTAQPRASVVIGILADSRLSVDARCDAVSEYSVCLVFTPANWNVSQPVAVELSQDLLRAQIAHKIVSGDDRYLAVNVDPVMVTPADGEGRPLRLDSIYLPLINVR